MRQPGRKARLSMKVVVKSGTPSGFTDYLMKVGGG